MLLLFLQLAGGLQTDPMILALEPARVFTAEMFVDSKLLVKEPFSFMPVRRMVRPIPVPEVLKSASASELEND